MVHLSKSVLLIFALVAASAVVTATPLPMEAPSNAGKEQPPSEGTPTGNNNNATPATTSTPPIIPQAEMEESWVITTHKNWPVLSEEIFADESKLREVKGSLEAIVNSYWEHRKQTKNWEDSAAKDLYHEIDKVLIRFKSFESGEMSLTWLLGDYYFASSKLDKLWQRYNPEFANQRRLASVKDKAQSLSSVVNSLSICLSKAGNRLLQEKVNALGERIRALSEKIAEHPKPVEGSPFTADGLEELEKEYEVLKQQNDQLIVAYCSP